MCPPKLCVPPRAPCAPACPPHCLRPQVQGTEFYQDAGFLAGGYFPELDAYKLTDMMEMYPQPDKSPTGAMEPNRYGSNNMATNLLLGSLYRPPCT